MFMGNDKAELVIAGVFALVLVALYQDEIVRLLRRLGPTLAGRARIPRGFYESAWWKGAS